MPLRPLYYIGLCLLSVLSLAACKNDSTTPDKSDQPPTTTVTEPPTRYTVPKFDGASAYQLVEKQVAFGPRVPNSEAHRKAKDWKVAYFKELGWDVQEQNFKAEGFNGTVYNGTNIIARYNPNAKKKLLYAAHWDSRFQADEDDERQSEPIDGADDGASGTAILMELAKVLKDHPIQEKDMGIDIVLFDVEDQGSNDGKSSDTWCLGSQYWAKNPHFRAYKYGILLDMVGSKNPRFGYEYFSANYAPNVVRKVWKLAIGMGYGNYFVEENAGAVTDDHYYVNQIGIPMIDIINKPTQNSFGDYWHTHNDGMDIISEKTLRIVGQVMTAVTYKEASGTFR